MQFIIYGERLDQGASLCCYVLFVLRLFLFVLIMYFLSCGMTLTSAHYVVISRSDKLWVTLLSAHYVVINC